MTGMQTDVAGMVRLPMAIDVSSNSDMHIGRDGVDPTNAVRDRACPCAAAFTAPTFPTTLMASTPAPSVLAAVETSAELNAAVTDGFFASRSRLYP